MVVLICHQVQTSSKHGDNPKNQQLTGTTWCPHLSFIITNSFIVALGNLGELGQGKTSQDIAFVVF